MHVPVLVAVAVAAACAPRASVAPTAGAVPAGTSNQPLVEVGFDPRIELATIVFKLAGASEFDTGTFPAYAAAIDTFFAAHREHPAVLRASRLRHQGGISNDAVISLAVQLGQFPELVERMPFEEAQLERWPADEARAFAAELRDFARVSDAAAFFERHKPLYDVAIRRLRAVIDAEVDEQWVDDYFGGAPQSRFINVVSFPVGSIAYSARYYDPDGARELYSVLTPSQRDQDGMPMFNFNHGPIVVHEFGHSYVNPVVEKNLPLLRPHADSVLAAVADRMAQIGYRETRTLVSESLIRAMVARYKLAHLGEAAARSELLRQRNQGFLWIDEVYALLDRYERERSVYGDFEAFFPHVAEYFRQLAPRMPAVLAADEARRPTVVSVTPPNGSTSVDPATSQISIRFDRPMRANAWALVPGPRGLEDYPEAANLRYDATRTVFTMDVTLKPEWSYEFSLNSPSTSGFFSEDGMPLAPYTIKFSTGPAR